MKDTALSRLIMIALASFLLLALAINITKGLRADQQEAINRPLKGQSIFSRPVEDPEAKEAERDAIFDRMPANKANRRTMAVYYSRRAYPGAPPVIPHPDFDERGTGGRSCLGCHRDGGYVESLQAYAPVTPHPDLLSCTSCHVPQTGKEPFRTNEFRAMNPPALDRAAGGGVPPPIPHSLQMRTNCLACHANSATPTAIRMPHPAMPNCQSCHEPQGGDTWAK